jgi:hypothetical protein
MLFPWLALFGGFAVASSNANSPSYPPLPETGRSDLTPFSLATGTSEFVTARDGKLYLDDAEYTFSSFNAVGSNLKPAHLQDADESHRSLT